MKTYINTITYILFLILLQYFMVSCEKMIDVDLPNNQIPSEQVFEDVQTADAALTALYSSLWDNSPLAGDQTGKLLGTYTDDLSYYATTSTNGILNLFQNTHTDSNAAVYAYWASAYQKIYMANAIIEGVEKSHLLPTADKNRLKGEALLVRSMLFFYLQQIYGDIPLPTTTDYNINKTLSKTGSAQVLTTIEADLNTVISLISNDYRNAERIYPNKKVAELMLGKVYMAQNTPTKEKPKELSISLGESQDSIMSKNDAYDAFFKKEDNRTMLEGLDKEKDSLLDYEDQLSLAQKRKIDSLKAVSGRQNRYQSKGNLSSYYNPKKEQNDDGDYKRSSEIIRMLNDKSYGKPESDYASEHSKATPQTPQQNPDPVKYLKQQMLVMDSLEKARDPEYQSKLAAEEKLKMSKEKMEEFLNSTFNVNKSGINSEFNAFYKEKENSFIKAVIDENNKGYLGSRIRLRLLEDIFVGNKKLSKGSILYGQISGFAMQRVNLSIVSVFTKGEIYPVNLSVYDVDGMKGLYVPESIFRDMMREMGSNSVQGTQMDMGVQGFFTSIGSKLFTSTSKSIANLIKTNKAKLKYNSYVFLIDEKQLKDSQNQQKK